MSKFKYFIEAAKNFETVSTVTFSSTYLVKDMISPIDFSKQLVVAELGAGNGAITKGLLKKLNPASSIISFEINSKFCEMLKEELTDERLILVNNSAEFLEKYLNEEGFSQVDHIVSSIPLVGLPKDLIARIINTCKKVIKPNGFFTQLSYSPLERKRLIRDFQFKSVELKFSPINLPPAWVYICQF